MSKYEWEQLLFELWALPKRHCTIFSASQTILPAA